MLLAICTCTPLLVALAAAFLTCVGGGYGVGSWGAKTLALVRGYETSSAADLGGAIVGAVGFSAWAGYVLGEILKWLTT